jgi:hypothetical protein
MTSRIFLFPLLILFLFQSKSYGQFFPDPGGSSGTLNEKLRHIDEGEHSSFSKPKKIRFTHTNRRYKYHLKFNENCWYEPASGCGWNKVGRISYGNGGFNYNRHKLHVGWRAGNNNGEIRLSAYFHDCNSDVQYFSQELKTVSTNTTVYIDMFLGKDIIALIVDNTCFGARKTGYISPNVTSFLHRTFYFGGNCTAPQYMEALFSCQENDQPGFSEWFNSREIMTWNATEFEYGDNGEFYAFKTINGSSLLEYVNSSVTCIQNAKQRCIINPGANITFIAGENVILHPGFAAKEGSSFRAMISSDKSHIVPKSNLFSQEKPEKLTDKPDSIINRKVNRTITISPGDKYNNNIFKIYPNPNDGIFHIAFYEEGISTFSVEIFNTMGHTVFQQQNIPTGTMQINLASQATGIYFVKVYAGDQVYTEKVVYQ